MTIDTNDTGTIDLLTVEPEQVARSELERQANRLRVERDALESKLEPLQALADALAALPVFRELADDLDDLRDRVDSLETSIEDVPTLDDVADRLEYGGTIENVVETVLADRADDPADNIDELAKAVADRLSVDVEVESVDVSASVSLS